MFAVHYVPLYRTGKYVPTIARKIHEENPTSDLQINLVGIGIGDGFMSPPETAVYAEYLYQVIVVPPC